MLSVTDNEFSFADGRRFLLLVTTPGLAVTMLAAGLSFNIPEDDRARIPVISIFFFLFMVLYSVGVGTLPSTSHPLTAAAWDGTGSLHAKC